MEAMLTRYVHPLGVGIRSVRASASAKEWGASRVHRHFVADKYSCSGQIFMRVLQIPLQLYPVVEVLL